MAYHRSVFLSYSHRDEALASWLADELESRQVWVCNYYSWVSSGRFWTPPKKIKLIEEALQYSDAIIVIVSSHGLDDWQKREVQAALDQQVHRKLQLIPVLFEGASPYVMPEHLRSHPFVRWRHGFERMALADLLLRLQRIFEESRISPPYPDAFIESAPITFWEPLIAQILVGVSYRLKDQIYKIGLLFKQFIRALPQTRITFYLLVFGLAGFILLSALTDQEEIVALGTLNIAIIGMWMWALFRKARALAQSSTPPKGDAPEV